MTLAIGIIGSGDPSRAGDPSAYELGGLVAESGALLVCGGLSGMMEAASKGAYDAGGVTLGFLPGDDKNQANPFIKIPIPTGMGVGRNLLVVKAADALIALEGSAGTLSEIALSINIGRPVIDLGDWGLDGMIPAGSNQEAVEKALRAAARGAVRDANQVRLSER